VRDTSFRAREIKQQKWDFVLLISRKLKQLSRARTVLSRALISPRVREFSVSINTPFSPQFRAAPPT
jgi:hypothetical protein